MKNKIIALFCVFSYIYQIGYVFLPLNFSCTIGILGFVFYFINKNKYFKYWNEPHKLLVKTLTLLVPVGVIALFSIILNMSVDLYFFKWAVINMFYVFGAYMVVQLIAKGFGKFDFHILVHLLALSGVIQVSLSLVMYLNPNIGDLFQSLMVRDEIETNAISETSGLRMLGFGTYFFGSGLTHGIMLIMMAMELNNKTLSIKLNVLYYLAFVYITVVGLMMSRTTLIGASIGLLLILFSRLKSIKAVFKFIISTAATCVVIMIIVHLLPSNLYKGLDDISRFGFEMFINYEEKGSLNTVSTDHMFKDMYVFPTNTKTWLIGDALWADPLGNGYYMHTDIGYCKMIFYFGVIGMLFFFLFEYLFIKRVFPTIIYGDVPLLAFLGYVFIINAKGLCDILPFIIMCYFCRYTFSNYPKQKLLLHFKISK
jgi:hypothetical protein